MGELAFHNGGIYKDPNRDNVYVVWPECTYDGLYAFETTWYYHYSTEPNKDIMIATNPETKTPSSDNRFYFDVSTLTNYINIDFIKARIIAKTHSADYYAWHVWNIAEWGDPGKPNNQPELTISKSIEATMSLSNIVSAVNATGVAFELYKNTTSQDPYFRGVASITNGFAELKTTVEYGAKYFVRAALYNSNTSWEEKDGEKVFPNITDANWSEGWVGPVESAPTPVENFKINSEVVSAGAAVNLSFSWKKNEFADDYEVQYTDAKYDWSFVDKLQSFSTDQTTYTLQLNNGGDYRFRIRATNNAGESSWIEETKNFGLAPLAPTTWSDVTKTLNDGQVNLYWKHNAQDSTREFKAEVSITSNTSFSKNIVLDRTDRDEKDWYKNDVYVIDTTQFTKTTTLYWKVRTCGASGVYGEWSIVKELTVYVTPKLTGWVQDDTTTISEEKAETVITSYPYMITSIPYEDTNPNEVVKIKFMVFYDVINITNYLSYEYTYPNLSYMKLFSRPDWIMNVTIDALDTSGKSVWTTTLHDRDAITIDKPHDDAYKYKFTVVTSNTAGKTMDEVSKALPVRFVSEPEEINQKITDYTIQIETSNAMTRISTTGSAENLPAGTIIYKGNFTNDDAVDNIMFKNFGVLDTDLVKDEFYKYTITAYFLSGYSASQTGTFKFSPTEINTNPMDCTYIYDEDGKIFKIYIEFDEPEGDVYIRGYRRNSDGTFTEVLSYDELMDFWLIDKRPRLDIQRYIICAIDKTSGWKDFFNVQNIAQPKFPVIQWGNSFKLNVSPTGEVSMPKDNMIEFIYNLDIVENRSINNDITAYAGRSLPVAYYGSEKTESYTWNFEVPSYDTEILAKLKALAVYNDNVYVRLPNGEGYWAVVTVTITNTHNSVTRKVTMNITKTWSQDYD